MSDLLMYGELAPWWPLLSAPEDYADEAATIRDLITRHEDAPTQTVLELGSGGGNTASHLKAHYTMTLLDRAAPMLEISRALNPECAHHQGDMRRWRDPARFDAALIHDAIAYMTTEDDLLAALHTATAHLRPGGTLVVVPDEVAETYAPDTSCGGHDAPDGRGLRYLEWDLPSTGTTTQTLYTYTLRDPSGATRTLHETHTFGLFPRDTWRTLMARAGAPVVEIFVDAYDREVFVGRRPHPPAPSPGSP